MIMPFSSTYDFDGLFTMDIPIGKHYSNAAWCKPSGGLGCANEYWEDNAGCEIDQDEFVVYYYNNSILCDGESNAWQHAVNGLTTSYLYDVYQNNGGMLVLTNDIGMRNLPPYIVGVTNDDGSEVVFVGGFNLDDLKKYASSVNFK